MSAVAVFFSLCFILFIFVFVEKNIKNHLKCNFKEPTKAATIGSLQTAASK